MDMMPMYFTFNWPAHILFQPWAPASRGQMAGACVAIFLLAVCFEGLKLARRLLFQWDARRQPALVLKESEPYASPAAGALHTAVVVPGGARWRGLLRPMHGVQTLLQGLQFVLGYFLMLAAMTFSVWLFVAMILGTMVGYFIFQWYPVAPGYFPLHNEHCH